MTLYKVIGTLCRFNVGSKIGLTDSQVKGRRHCLAQAGFVNGLLGKFSNGISLWIVEKPVEFKRGEILWVDGAVNKALLADLEEAPARTSAKVPAQKDGAGKKGARGKKDAQPAEMPPPSESDETEGEAEADESEFPAPPTIPMFTDPEDQTDDEP